MRNSTIRRRSPLALTATLLTAVALTATGCGGGQTVSTEEPEKQSRFEQRAERVAQVWPKTKPVEGRHDAMLPAESARPAGGAKDGSARTVDVTVGHSACDKDYGAHVEETKELVIVAGWAKKKKKNVDVCTGQLVTDRVPVKLNAEIGSRKIVDAATGKELKG